MSCSFWLLRKRKAAMKRKLEAEKAPIVEKPVEKVETAEKKPVKKAVKADDTTAD